MLTMKTRRQLFIITLHILQAIRPESSSVSGSGECPITGQSAAFDPYSEPSNQYYLKQIRLNKIE